MDALLHDFNLIMLIFNILTTILLITIGFPALAQIPVDTSVSIESDSISNSQQEMERVLEQLEPYWNSFLQVFYASSRFEDTKNNSSLNELYARMNTLKNEEEKYLAYKDFYQSHKSTNLKFFLYVEVIRNLSDMIQKYSYDRNTVKVVQYFLEYEAFIKENGGLNELFRQIVETIDIQKNEKEFRMFKEWVLNPYYAALISYTQIDIAYSFPLLDVLEEYSSVRRIFAKEYLDSRHYFILGTHWDKLLQDLGYDYKTSASIKDFLFPLVDRFNIRRQDDFETQKNQYINFFDYIHNYVQSGGKFNAKNFWLYGLLTDRSVLNEFQLMYDNWESYSQKDRSRILSSDAFMCNYYSLITWFLLVSNGFEADLIFINDFKGKDRLNLGNNYYHVSLIVGISGDKYIFVDPINGNISEPFHSDEYKHDSLRKGRFLLVNSNREDLFYDYEIISPKFAIAQLYVAFGVLMMELNQQEKARIFCQKAIDYYPENFTGEMCLQALNANK